MRLSTASSQAAPHRLAMLDYIGLLFFAGIMYVTAVHRSNIGHFWSDEIMGFLVTHQPTWRGVMQLWRAGIDSSGFWYEVFARPWFNLFGTSILAVRLYSATAVVGAAVAIWVAARRLYSFATVAAAVPFVFATSLTVRWQLANARTYGFFLFATALVLYGVIRGSEEDRRQPGPLFLAGVFAANTLLAGSHILGPLYVMVCFAALIALDRYKGWFRPGLYLATLCSELTLILEWPNIQATAAVGKPSFWTVPPSYHDLLRLKWIFDTRVSGAILMFAVLAILMRQFHLQQRRAAVYALVASFACLAVFLFAYSRVATSVYVDRYFIPFALIGCLALCEATAMVVEAPGPRANLRESLAWLMVAMAIAAFFLPRLQRPAMPYPDEMPAFVARLPPGVPIVCTDVETFVEFEFYYRNLGRQRMLFPTDWPIALDPEIIGGVSGFHEMDNLKTFHLYDQDIAPTAEILRSYPDFAVVTVSPNVWFRKRIQANPSYVALPYTFFSPAHAIQPVEIWLVHHRH